MNLSKSAPQLLPPRLWPPKYDLLQENLFQLFHEEVLDTFTRYVFSDLPTYLIRISDMQLVSRQEIRMIFQPLMESITKVEFMTEACSWYIPYQERWTERKIHLLIQRHLRCAIFSHRWGIDEPSFQDLAQSPGGQGSRNTRTGPGFQKLLMFCEKAQEYGCKYVWSDTCCIDKTSSAELEEAIRSMFRWYRSAEVCIAYLSESSTLEDFDTEPWFSRGWTLQELLAPHRIKFYGKRWVPLLRGSEPDGRHQNDRSHPEIRRTIRRRTKIPDSDLQSFQPNCDRVYEKMVWAASRKTTRVEDVAYSLLGIFDVSMSVEYGEGKRAFHRLMETILQRSGEWGILAWAGPPSPYSDALPASPQSYHALDLEIASSLFPGYDSSFGPLPLLTETIPMNTTKFWIEVEVLIIDVEVVEAVVKGNRTNQTLTLQPRWDERIASEPWESIPVWFDTDVSPLFPPETWEIGIINFGRTRDGHGRLRQGMKYLCLLLGNTRWGLGEQGWVKLETKNVIAFRTGRDWEGKLTSLRLHHRFTTVDSRTSSLVSDDGNPPNLGFG